jgi:hypothetical protein
MENVRGYRGMTHRPRWFVLQELVPPEIFEARGDAAWELLDPRVLITADAIRDQFGATIINNWHAGGPFKESGFRVADSTTGAKLSQHRYGRAVDVKCKNATPEEVHAYILANPDKFPEITTLEAIEATPTWVHVDCRNSVGSGIRIVRP